MSRTYDHGGNIFDIARQLGTDPSTFIDFSASINPLGISLKVKKAIICALESLVHYPDNSHTELKRTLAGYHGLSPAHIAVANGSTEIIYHLPAMLPGKRALIISPSFNEYVRSLAQQHWEARHFILKPEDNFSIDLAALEQTLSEGFDALYLCNPGNPNGTLYPLRAIEQIYSLCIASGTFLVLDEAFMDFCEESSAKSIIVKGDNGLVLRSMTKFFGIPGLRLGYALSSGTLAERLDTMGGPWSVNTMALAAGVAALKDTGHNQQTIEYIDRERHNFFDRLSEFKQLRLYPSSTNFLLAEITEGMSALELRERLMHQRLLIRDCTNFMGLSPSFFRVAVRTTEENERLLGAMKRILK
ncbi:MAG: threonine-phosphate decarboxylase [Desulfuromonadales bacterium]|nr:threonine-phosphate decarboxylase [Desulfuromonadales bacterium]